ncbi:unnamed protein product [Anisakis simplex]|uniref:SSD domain-containing protein n=1 Tax=Anisakis simplex TaxID=6269 RepID=A0A0M3IZG4_ANISI|nr:unnamed protein product [Anisakis simplex]
MVVSWLLFFAYAALAIYGCSSIVVDISPKKYIRDNSPIQTFVELADKYIWADNVMPTFYVMNPPDLRDASARARLNELIYRLEHTEYSIGRVSTNFWLWEYQRFLNDFPNITYTTGFYDQKNLYDFFSQFDYQQYRPHVKMSANSSNGEPCIQAFTFQTSFYGLDSWDKRQVSDYNEFDMFLADIFSPFLIDQRKSIAPSSMQSIGSAIAVMAIISIFFLPDKQSVFFMTWSLLSISMGVCGGLSVWGSDLDSVSMGCIVMAIGLAVDFSVHICYRYHRSEQRTAHEKVSSISFSSSLFRSCMLMYHSAQSTNHFNSGSRYTIRCWLADCTGRWIDTVWNVDATVYSGLLSSRIFSNGCSGQFDWPESCTHLVTTVDFSVRSVRKSAAQMQASTNEMISLIGLSHFSSLFRFVYWCKDV